MDRAKPRETEKLSRTAARKADERAQHFIAYRPADANTESGLALERDKQGDTAFEKAANAAAVEVTADDDKGMYLESKRRVWIFK